MIPFCIPHIQVKGTISRLHGPFVSLLCLFCWTILLHLGTQLPAGRFVPPRPPNSDLGGRDALPWHPWRYPTPQPTKKIKVSCHPTIEVSYEKLTTSQCIPIFLPKFNSKLKPWNWLSKDDESGGVSNFGRGTLFGLEHQVYRTRIFKQTHHIYWQMYIGLWAMAPNQGVQNGTLTCAHNWCRIYRWSDPFFLEGGKAGVNSGSILVKQTKFSQEFIVDSNRQHARIIRLPIGLTPGLKLGKWWCSMAEPQWHPSDWYFLVKTKNFQSHQYTTKKV